MANTRTTLETLSVTRTLGRIEGKTRNQACLFALKERDLNPGQLHRLVHDKRPSINTESGQFVVRRHWQPITLGPIKLTKGSSLRRALAMSLAELEQADKSDIKEMENDLLSADYHFVQGEFQKALDLYTRLKEDKNHAQDAKYIAEQIRLSEKAVLTEKIEKTDSHENLDTYVDFLTALTHYADQNAKEGKALYTHSDRSVNYGEYTHALLNNVGKTASIPGKNEVMQFNVPFNENEKEIVEAYVENHKFVFTAERADPLSELRETVLDQADGELLQQLAVLEAELWFQAMQKKGWEISKNGFDYSQKYLEQVHLMKNYFNSQPDQDYTQKVNTYFTNRMLNDVVMHYGTGDCQENNQHKLQLTQFFNTFYIGSEKTLAKQVKTTQRELAFDMMTFLPEQTKANLHNQAVLGEGQFTFPPAKTRPVLANMLHSVLNALKQFLQELKGAPAQENTKTDAHISERAQFQSKKYLTQSFVNWAGQHGAEYRKVDKGIEYTPAHATCGYIK